MNSPGRLVAISFLALTALAGQSLPTAATVAAAAIHARGGEQKIGSIQTERISGQIEAGGEIGTFSLCLKRPQKIRLELVFNSKRVIKASDGKDTWQMDETAESTAQPSTMSTEQKTQFLGDADIDGPFLHYEAKGIKIEPLDVEMLGSSQVWKVRVTAPSTPEMFYYIETTGGYTLMREFPAPSGKSSKTVRQFYRDFRMVKDMPFPFLTVSVADGGQPVTLRVDQVEINTDVDEGLFSMTKR